MVLMLGLAGCGGLYDVGSGDAEGGAAGAGSPDAVGGNGVLASGGALPTGSGGVGSSPEDAAGGSVSTTGGTATAGVSGTSTSGSGGESIGGSGGGVEYPCPYPVVPATDMAEPAVVWERISRFLYDELREPLSPLPETTTLAWVEATVDEVVFDARRTGNEPLAGISGFLHGWFFENEPGTEDRARDWATGLLPVGSLSTALFQGSPPPHEARSSLLLEPSFLRRYATISRRGTFIANKLLCFGLTTPSEPTTVTITPEPRETSRDALERETAAPKCAGCHSAFDPFGYALSHLDAAGNYRETENGLPIDATGAIEMTNYRWEFDGLNGLYEEFAYSWEVSDCVGINLFTYAIEKVRGETFAPYDPTEEGMYASCESLSYYNNFARMLQGVAMTPSFVSR